MADGLNIGRLVRVNVNLEQPGAARRGFGVLMVVGDSDVISGAERFRTYGTLEGVAADFGTSAPEYQAANLYFIQKPRPDVLMIGRWLRTATAGFINGGILNAVEQDIAVWTPITDGTFDISIDGTPQSVTGLDFSAETNLNGVASQINTVLTGATCTWDGSRFKITSATTGVTSTVSYATTEGTGTDISAMLKLTIGLAIAPVNGFDAETPLAAVIDIETKSTVWYGLTFAASVMPTDPDVLNIAAYIEATKIKRVYGVTDQSPDAWDPLFLVSLGQQLKDLGYIRTSASYSSTEPYEMASFLARAFSVDFNENNSTVTMMYKDEPGVVSEVLTEEQANTLKDRRYNVFARYDNNTAIIQYGVMSGPAYFDEIHGLDWFADAIQTAVYNLLLTTPTKIPQTDAGQNQLIGEVAKVCDQAVANGLLAEGTWGGPNIGQQQTGNIIVGGYYIFSELMATQSSAARADRIAPLVVVCAKAAGAIHEADILIEVNR